MKGGANTPPFYISWKLGDKFYHLTNTNIYNLFSK
jgi:hypothetical protein